MADFSDLNPAFAQRLQQFRAALDAAGIKYGMESGYRSPEQQSEIYTRSHQGKDFAAAPPWRSFHNYGLAADIIPQNANDYQRMWDIAPQYGLKALGAYDKPHFQLAGALPELISQYHLANWRPESMPAPTTGAIAYGGPSGQPSRPGTPTPGPLMFAGVNADARGMRNNNPGNLVSSDWVSTLPGYKGSDGKFAIFDTPEHGAAALDRNLTSYGSKGINTPLGIASTWAPASDNNNPNSYGAQIAKALGVGPNDKIDMGDPSVRNKISQAIALVENGPGQSAGFRTAYVGSATPGTTINSSPVVAGAPPAAAGAPAPAAPAGGLPGFQAGSAGEKMAQAGLKQLTGGGGGGEVRPMQLQQPLQAQAVGGPMMLGAGGQNVPGRSAQMAQSNLAQLAALAQANSVQPVPGTTLNSMALQAGMFKSPFDTYANPDYYRAGSA